MRIATTVFLTDRTAPPVRLARALETRGFSGLYLPEHTHIPVERTTAAPMGGELPEMYGRSLDPFVALGQAAAVTERLGLGTGITLVAQHDPIVLAKQAATLDHLSGGRFTLGVGYGWNVEEAADHGVEWGSRRELVGDRLALMRALWAPVPTAYAGPYGSVRASQAHPKPATAPRALGPDRPLYGPRTLIGGRAGPKLFAAIAGHADGWLPIGGSGLAEDLPALRRAWEEAGRTPDSLQVVPYAVQATPGKLSHYADLGIEEVVLQLPSAGEPEILRALDGFAQYL
ncbi:TIGR03619 family F420-dependent LLM class oxidoreductase [Streptomyces sp. NPDC051567]|uniref:TIGR03619 family F420-dependent LLM class oxidoreductase n=1 Tax=Streptomyces sp. NPDC051567 TaxID=3365660 RepID=UPI0037892EAD